MDVSYFGNRYNGKCVGCGTKVTQFEGICFQLNGKWAVGCRSCYPAESAGVYAARDKAIADAQAKQDQLEARRLELIEIRRQAIERTGIQPDKAYDCKTTQGAWNDFSVWKIPFTGDGTDADFFNALRSSPQSLYGQLRASQGVNVNEINREGKYVVVSESVSLCD